MRGMDVPNEASTNNEQAIQTVHEKKYDLPNQAELDKELRFWINDAFPEKVEELLKRGANPNGCINGITHLMRTAMDCNLTSCELLINYGASLDAQDSNGQTALIKCANESGIYAPATIYGESSHRYADICKMLVDAAAVKAKKQNTLCLLYRLKQMKKEGRPGADVLSKESKDLLRPHLQHAYCKPVELLRMRDNKGQTAFDLMPLPFLDPEEKTNSPIAKLMCGPNQRAALMCKVALIKIDEKYGLLYFRTFFKTK